MPPTRKWAFRTTLFLLVLSVPVSLAGVARARDQVPFRAAFSGKATPTSVPGSPGLRDVDATAAGKALHLGRVSATGRHRTNLETLTLTGSFTLAGSSGDTLTGVYSGLMVPTADPNVVTVNGPFTITGGTGRFQGATGGGLATGTADCVTADFALSLDGSVSSPGSR